MAPVFRAHLAHLGGAMPKRHRSGSQSGSRDARSGRWICWRYKSAEAPNTPAQRVSQEPSPSIASLILAIALCTRTVPAPACPIGPMTKGWQSDLRHITGMHSPIRPPPPPHYVSQHHATSPGWLLHRSPNHPQLSLAAWTTPHLTMLPSSGRATPARQRTALKAAAPGRCVRQARVLPRGGAKVGRAHWVARLRPCFRY